MPTLSFYAGENFAINNLANSGLGFFGGGFGFSVEVGSFQDSTFITDGNGINEGPQVDNIKWINAQSGIVNGVSSGINIRAIPNYLATLNPRFTHTTPVLTQNVKLRIYDRADINNDPSGVTCKVAELIHPTQVQIHNGSGDATWHMPTGSSVIMDLVASPGTSGLRPNGAGTTDTRHDWYTIISASPDSVGSKTQFGLYMSLEYI
jgi:hypothetical protein